MIQVVKTAVHFSIYKMIWYAFNVLGTNGNYVSYRDLLFMLCRFFVVPYDDDIRCVLMIENLLKCIAMMFCLNLIFVMEFIYFQLFTLFAISTILFYCSHLAKYRA